MTAFAPSFLKSAGSPEPRYGNAIEPDGNLDPAASRRERPAGKGFPGNGKASRIGKE
jgi:hypothetical protein